jgi:hypothetical protein
MADKKGIVLARIDRPFGGSRASHYVETKKMVSFVCPQGQHYGHIPASREECQEQGHDPYFTTKNVLRTEEKTRQDGDRLIVEGTESYYEKVRTPNWEQVVHDIANDSGQLVSQRLAMGWVFPEDLGYAPFCDFLGCSIQNPKFRTTVGNYHHRDEAALMYLAKGGREDSTKGTAIFIDDTTSGEARRQQLDEVASRFVREDR